MNEAFAKKFDLGRDAVGKRMSDSSGNDVKLDIEIVGLVQNAKYSEVKQEFPPVFFLPVPAGPAPRVHQLLRADARDPEQLLPPIIGVMARLDANLPVENLKTLEQQVARTCFSTA